MQQENRKTPKTGIYKRLVEHFGGVSKTARALETAQSTVSGWLTGDHGMSGAVAIKAEMVTAGEFKAAELIGARKWRNTAAGAI